jgi:hypothetical protein
MRSFGAVGVWPWLTMTVKADPALRPLNDSKQNLLTEKRTSRSEISFAIYAVEGRPWPNLAICPLFDRLVPLLGDDRLYHEIVENRHF